MTLDVLFEIYHNFLGEGYGRNKYTKKAFNVLPKLDKTYILDIGCGPGAQTIEQIGRASCRERV